MFSDRVMTGVAIGICADIIKLIVNYVLFQLNYTKIVFWQIAASRFLNKEDLFKPTAYFIGGVADIIVTSLLGILLVYILYFVGKDFLLIKGIGYGLSIWVLLFGTLLTASASKLPEETSGIIVTIIAHLFYGLAFGIFSKIFYKEENFE